MAANTNDSAAQATTTTPTTHKPVTGEVGKGVSGKKRVSPKGTIHRVVGKDKNPAVDKRIQAERETRIEKRRGEPTEPREDSKRGQLLGMLRKGGVEEKAVCRKFDWKPRDFMDALRLLARVNGYPIKVSNGKASLIRG
jgi:hypothetical protein